jgi:cytochrome P450
MQQRGANKHNLLALRRHYTHPHELYNTLRVRDQIYFDETSQSWLVTGHKAATTILDDSRFITSLGTATSTSSMQKSPVSRQILFLNGEQHRRAQNIMLRPLALMVKQMPSIIRKFAQDSLAVAREAGEMEFVNEFASPVSLFTIAHVLGIPLEDRDELRCLENWSDTFGDVTSGYFRGDLRDIERLEDYFRQLVAQKRRTPSDDLLSAFIEAGDIFPHEEDLVANCMMVFAAGRITTKKLLANGISLLMQGWGELQQEFARDARFPKFLGEELLRMVTPTRYLIRDASKDVDLSALFPGNHFIHRGERMMLFLEAADYDPSLFSQPEQFDPHRRPNKHIAFGYGPHQCPGATLARVELQIALEEVLSLNGLRPKPGTSPLWNPNPNLGGFNFNPVICAVDHGHLDC